MSPALEERGDAPVTPEAPAPAVVHDERWRKSDRLLRRADFLRVQQHGRRFTTPRIVVLSLPTASGRRVGLTVSRKVGDAPRRNLVKRRLREIFRRNKERWPDGLDVVVIARAAAAEAPASELAQDLFRWARRAHASPSPMRP